MAKVSYQDVAGTILSNLTAYDVSPGTAQESMRVYRSNDSAFAQSVIGQQNKFYSRIDLPVKTLNAGGRLSDDAALDVIQSFAFMLNDVSIAVVNEQRRRLSANKFTLPTMGIVLNLSQNAESIGSVGKWLRERQGDDPKIAKAKDAYESFLVNAKEDNTNTAAASDLREAKKAERKAAITPPPAPVTPEEQAAEASLQQEPAVEEKESEQKWVTTLESTGTLGFFLRKNWWVFVGLAVGLYAFAAWRSRQKRRQLQE